ncbi:magnesium transporter [Waddlia chondrophila]|uniref:Putative Mg2+ transporter n=1 Tax=Waddlia chondrophila (strain ATCC VR-1470 / WSU 86-1044) TaxID=716544 RepID=D6YW08_WADCW|nr:magnesium transporter [Waddlia chondrophila]ADI38319.1 putative Mg2+ transporter [Waddlia chondrophila WSU 86-1044]
MDHPEDHIEEPEEVEIEQDLLDSRTQYLDDVLNEKLERAFHKQTSQLLLHDVAKIAIDHDPIDLAYAVTRLPASARIVLYDHLPDFASKVTFIIHTTRNTRSVIFRQISDKEIKELIEKMPPDEAVNILDDISDRRLKKVMDLLDHTQAYRIKELQKHERNSAGRLMTDEFFAFPMTTTIGEVSRYIRDHPGIDLTRSIFVLSDNKELAGYVPARNLIVNPPFLPLKQVMRPVLHTVRPDSTRDEVVDIVERYGIPTLPVINENEELVGVIPYEDVVEAMEDIADETIASIAGTGEDFSEHEPIFKRYLWRVPWLIVTLLAGMVTSTTMTQFEGRSWFAIVPFFVPLIAGMSGNVGLQCSTILVRGMATGELSPGQRKEAIAKEIAIGGMIGVTFGVSCSILVYFLNYFGIQHAGGDPFAVGMLVGWGLFFACMTATVLGSFSPFFFVRIGVDPAVASGPIVTAFNDVTSTLMFLLVARGIYALLF